MTEQTSTIRFKFSLDQHVKVCFNGDIKKGYIDMLGRDSNGNIYRVENPLTGSWWWVKEKYVKLDEGE